MNLLIYCWISIICKLILIRWSNLSLFKMENIIRSKNFGEGLNEMLSKMRVLWGWTASFTSDKELYNIYNRLLCSHSSYIQGSNLFNIIHDHRILRPKTNKKQNGSQTLSSWPSGRRCLWEQGKAIISFS